MAFSLAISSEDRRCAETRYPRLEREAHVGSSHEDSSRMDRDRETLSNAEVLSGSGPQPRLFSRAIKFMPFIKHPEILSMMETFCDSKVS